MSKNALLVWGGWPGALTEGKVVAPRRAGDVLSYGLGHWHPLGYVQLTAVS